MILRAALAVAVAMIGAGAASAAPAPPAAAGWPCETDPKPALALGDYWPDAARMKASANRVDPALDTLVAEVAPRRLDQAEAVDRLRAFVARSGSVAERVQLATALLDTIDGERKVILDGIRRFNSRQDQLAKRIEQGYAALDAPDAAQTGEARQALEDQARWDQRIFEDRQRMLPIICRQPAILEARVAALIAAVRPGASR
ncbi:MAG TPA: hypothetical protein VF649_02915 [Sphingomonas sp.]|jgi:hypothetical protein|uniref:hypothetical protein n=1 Tax=Sphingomonas sp. TaxID=28214 RepID=UPI002EDB8AB6